MKTRLNYALGTDTLDLWTGDPDKEHIAEPINGNSKPHDPPPVGDRAETPLPQKRPSPYRPRP